MPNQNAKFARVGKLSSALVIVVMVLGGIGLFGIYVQHRTVERAFGAVEWIRAVEFALRELEVDFKVEVQEWKNLLLRGQTPENFTKWRATYEAQVKKTQAAFEQLKKSGITPDEIKSIESAAKLHSENAKLYQEALAGYRPNDPSSIFATDEKVRGRDREIAARLSELADALRNRDQEFVSKAQQDGEELYRTSRILALGVSILAITMALIAAIWIARLARVK